MSLLDYFLPTGVLWILGNKGSLTNGVQRSCVFERVRPLPGVHHRAPAGLHN
jgi:hypothetical protein